MCTELQQLGVNPIADNKYVYLYVYKYTKNNHLISTPTNAHT